MAVLALKDRTGSSGQAIKKVWLPRLYARPPPSARFRMSVFKNFAPKHCPSPLPAPPSQLSVLIPRTSCCLTNAVAVPDHSSSALPRLALQYIESAHPEIKFAQHSLRAALKAGVEKGKLIQTKSSYKLSPDEKKPPKKKKVDAPRNPSIHRVLRPFPAPHCHPRPASITTLGTQEEGA